MHINSSMADLVSEAKVITSKNKYSDLDLFFTPHPITKDLTVKTDTDSIKRSVKNIVLTNFYERPFKPSLGGGIRNLLFELSSDRRIRSVAKRIKKTIEDFEPRVSNVRVDLDTIDNDVSVYIQYDITGGVNSQNVQFAVTRVR